MLAVALACSSAHESSAQPSPAPQGSGGINRAEHRQKPSLLVVSFDGFRADYLDRFDLPNFRRVMTRGTRARGMHPVFPTITFPNHYSLVTGLYPEHHGIVENSFYDPVRKDTFSFRNFQTVSDGTWFGGEPIWVTAERQGMVSACFFWPGSEADIKGIRPTYWNRYDGSVPNEQRIETVLGWLRLPAERRPHVITLYFSDVDSASHKAAIGGSDVAAAVMAVDRSLGMLLDGLDRLENRDRVLLMLTSDHGMADTGSVRIVQLGDVIDTTGVRAGFSGPVTALHVSPEAGTPAAVRDRINAKLEHGRAYLRQEVPERHHFRATPARRRRRRDHGRRVADGDVDHQSRADSARMGRARVGPGSPVDEGDLPAGRPRDPRRRDDPRGREHRCLSADDRTARPAPGRRPRRPAGQDQVAAEVDAAPGHHLQSGVADAVA